MKPLYLEFVNSGVANRFDLGEYEVIEMNHRLKLYPGLFFKILDHELEHSEGKFKTKDLIHDMKSKTPGLYKFMFNHISAWTQILPFYYDRKRKLMVYDITTITSWVLMLGIFIGSYYLLRWLL